MSALEEEEQTSSQKCRAQRRHSTINHSGFELHCTSEHVKKLEKNHHVIIQFAENIHPSFGIINEDEFFDILRLPIYFEGDQERNRKDLDKVKKVFYDLLNELSPFESKINENAYDVIVHDLLHDPDDDDKLRMVFTINSFMTIKYLLQILQNEKMFLQTFLEIFQKKLDEAFESQTVEVGDKFTVGCNLEFIMLCIVLTVSLLWIFMVYSSQTFELHDLFCFVSISWLTVALVNACMNPFRTSLPPFHMFACNASNLGSFTYSLFKEIWVFIGYSAATDSFWVAFTHWHSNSDARWKNIMLLVSGIMCLHYAVLSSTTINNSDHDKHERAAVLFIFFGMIYILLSTNIENPTAFPGNDYVLMVFWTSNILLEIYLAYMTSVLKYGQTEHALMFIQMVQVIAASALKKFPEDLNTKICVCAIVLELLPFLLYLVFFKFFPTHFNTKFQDLDDVTAFKLLLQETMLIGGSVSKLDFYQVLTHIGAKIDKDRIDKVFADFNDNVTCEDAHQILKALEEVNSLSTIELAQKLRTVELAQKLSLKKSL